MEQDTATMSAEGTVRSSIVDHRALEDRAREFARRDANGEVSTWVSSHCDGVLGMEALVHLFESDELGELVPRPLSGEWAGQSMWEVLDLDPSDFDEDDTDEIGMACDTFESAYTEQWVHTFEEEARRLLESEVTSWKSEIDEALANAIEHLRDVRAWLGKLHVEQSSGASALNNWVHVYGKYVDDDSVVHSMTDALDMLDRFNRRHG